MDTNSHLNVVYALMVFLKLLKKIKPPDQISNLTKILPNIKPAVAVNTILKTALHNGNTPDEVSELASKLENQQVQKRKSNN